jgi:hypothetical protein
MAWYTDSFTLPLLNIVKYLLVTKLFLKYCEANQCDAGRLGATEGKHADYVPCHIDSEKVILREGEG